MQFAPSTYYAARNRPLSPRRIRDGELKAEILGVYEANRSVYGARKIQKQLRREGIEIGLDRVERLMRELGIQGAVRGKKTRTTIAGEDGARPADLIDRDFRASEPNRRWVADFTYVPTWSGTVYVAFVIDLFSRMILGWSVSRSMTVDFVLEALEMAIWRRDADLEGLVHHSDRGSQYRAIRYSERLEAAGAVPSVGSRGDSYDNAVAESTIGLYKTELIAMLGPWRNADQIEIKTLSYLEWYNTQRLHGFCGDIPPVEFEDRYRKDRAA